MIGQAEERWLEKLELVTSFTDGKRVKLSNRVGKRFVFVRRRIFFGRKFKNRENSFSFSVDHRLVVVPQGELMQNEPMERQCGEQKKIDGQIQMTDEHLKEKIRFRRNENL